MTADIDASRRIHDLEEQLRQARLASGWQPIDTVPHDRVVAVAFVLGDTTLVTLTSWVDHPAVDDMHWTSSGGSFPNSRARYWHDIKPLPKERLN